MEQRWLTYWEAAHRVRRDVTTIKRWRRNGMPMRWQDGRREVLESVLLAWWRDRMNASPVHQHRLRALRRSDALEG